MKHPHNRPSSLRDTSSCSAASFSGGSEALSSLRAEVDQLDQRLLELIATRMQVVRRIGDVKGELGMEVVQDARWQQVVRSRVERGNALGLSGDFLQRYLEALHQEAIAQQRG